MSNEEIKQEMKSFSELLEHKQERWPILNDDNEDEFYNAIDDEKRKIHKVAIECLNKILTPELKVFVKNLTFNTLGYPDEPIFYQAFGEYPEEEDKVSIEELNQKGINIEKLENYINSPNFEF